MSRKFFGIFILVLTFTVLGFSGQALAQNDEVIGTDEDTALIGLGTISQVATDQLLVKEYDFETDSEQDVKYLVNDKTKFENLNSIKDLKVGDSVEIVFAEENGQKVALSVSKEENYIDEDGEDTAANPEPGLENNSNESETEAATNPVNVNGAGR
jgi:hypothetical protein